MKALSENKITWLNNEISQSLAKKADAARKNIEKKYEFSEGASIRLEARLDEMYRKQSSIFVLTPTSETDKTGFQTRNSVIIAGAMLDYNSLRTAITLTQSAHNAGIYVYQYDISKASPVISRYFSEIKKRQSSMSHLKRNLSSLQSAIGTLYGERNTIEEGYLQHICCTNFSQLFSNIPKTIPVIAVDPWAAHAAVSAGMERVVNCIPDSVPKYSNLIDSAINAVQTHEGWFKSLTLNSLVKGKKQPKQLNLSQMLHNSGHYIEINTVKSIEKDCKKRVSRAKRGEPLRVLVSVTGENCSADMYRKIVKVLIPLVAPQKIALLINLGNNKNAWEAIKSYFSTSQSLVTTYFNKNDSLSFAHNASSTSVQGIHVFLNEESHTGVFLSNVLVRAADILVTEPDSLSFFPVPKVFLRPAGSVEQANAQYSVHTGDGITAHSFSALARAIQLMINDPNLIEYYCNAIVNNDRAGLYDGAYLILESALRKRIARVMYPE